MMKFRSRIGRVVAGIVKFWTQHCERDHSGTAQGVQLNGGRL
jgi:hypothetical protein